MNDYIPDPRPIPDGLEDVAEPYTPAPSPGEVMAGSKIMDRLNDADRETLRLWAMGGTGNV